MVRRLLINTLWIVSRWSRSFISKSCAGAMSRGGPLVVATMALVLMSPGCLLSNPPDFEETIGHRPVVLLRTPASQIVAIAKDDPEVGTTAFQAEVWDGDVDQILRYRWFLDYSPDALPQCGLVRGFLALSNGEEQRTAVYNLDHRVLTAGECHRLVVVVSDGEWRDGPHEGCAEVVQGANRTVADWWIVAYDTQLTVDDVTMGDCLPLASQNP